VDERSITTPAKKEQRGLEHDQFVSGC